MLTALKHYGLSCHDFMFNIDHGILGPSPNTVTCPAMILCLPLIMAFGVHPLLLTGVTFEDLGDSTKDDIPSL